MAIIPLHAAVIGGFGCVQELQGYERGFLKWMERHEAVRWRVITDM